MNSPTTPTRQTTGSSGLDSILSGGLPRNQIYLIDGDPGAGKTTLGLQFLREGAKLGERTLYVSLSESRKEILDVAESHGWSLDNVHIYEFKMNDELLVENQNTLFHPSEIELGETTRAILEAVEEVDPSRVVFDSLSELRLLSADSLRYRRQILALKHHFMGRKRTVLLLDDRTSGNSDLDLHSVVHGVIRLEQLAPEYGAERRRLRVLKLRGVRFRGGFHDFTIQKGGLEIYPRLIANEYATTKTLDLIQSGVPGLDELLGGGADRGSSTLLMGPAGSGKSTVTMQYAKAAVERGENTAIFAFDEGLRSIFKRAEGIGVDLEEYLKSGKMTLQQIDPAELTPGQFTTLVRNAVEARNVKVVIIDSLNGYLNAMPEERFLVIQMHELLSYLNQKGVATFIVVAQHGLLGSAMATPVDISYLADTVMLLRYFELDGEVRKAISIVKRRSGKHEKAIRELYINSDGVKLGEPLVNFRGILTGTPEPIIYE